MTGEFEFEKMLEDSFNDEINNGTKQPSVKDIADRYKEIFVKCPCCEHTIKIKLKV